MIIFYRIPFIDFRNFLDIDSGKLEMPFWPGPLSNMEFIRYGGRIFSRRKGGIEGWIGETQLCNIRNAIRFESLTTLPLEKNFKVKNIKIAAELFFHDGLACCFIDFIFVIKRSPHFKFKIPIDQLINYILNLKVSTRIDKNNRELTFLGTAQTSFEKFLLSATTKNNAYSGIKSCWIKSGQPIFFIQKDLPDEFITPNNAKRLYFYDNTQIVLTHWWINRFKIIHLRYLENDIPFEVARNFRIRLLRLHTEYECLKNLLHEYATEKQTLPNELPTIDRLQFYFNTTTKKIAKDRNELSLTFSGSNFEEVVKSSYEIINPGIYDGLMVQLKLLKTRRQVYQKIEQFTNGFLQTNNTYYMTTNVYGDGNILNYNGDLYIENLNQTFNKGIKKIENISLKNDIESFKGLLQELIKEGSLNEMEVKLLEKDSKDFIEEASSLTPRKNRLEVFLNEIAEFAKKSLKYVEPIASLVLKILKYF